MVGYRQAKAEPDWRRPAWLPPAGIRHVSDLFPVAAIFAVACAVTPSVSPPPAAGCARGSSCQAPVVQLHLVALLVTIPCGLPERVEIIPGALPEPAKLIRRALGWHHP